MKRRLIHPVAGLAFVLAATAVHATTLKFDELPFQPVDGLTFKGVTFGYEIGGSPSADAAYNSTAVGSLTYLDDPVLEGDAAGILSLTFLQPTYDVSFGLALSTFGDVNPAATVSFYDAGNVLLGSVNLTATSLVFFSEGFLSYVDTLTAVSRIELDFNEAEASRFAIDNLTYNVVNNPVPETGTSLAGLGVAALAGISGWRRRHRLNSAR